MPDVSKNIAIGALVSLALGLVLWVLLFLHPTFGDGGLQLHVRFQEIEKIGIGTRVSYAGRPVGEVKAISFVPENERTCPRFPDELYTYDLTIAIDSHIPIYSTDEITVGTSGLMGERYISIIPHRLNSKKSTLLTANQVVYSEKPPSIEDTFSQISQLVTKADQTIDSMATLIKDNRDTVDSTLKHIESIATTLDQPETFKQMLASLNKIHTAIDNVAHGEGSIGKLLVSNDFYFKTMAIMNKMDLMMNDVNHYGVLYHLDKGWQRDHRKRIEELAKLQNPQQFKAYLNDEMFKISTSISRVGNALEKAETLADTKGSSRAEFGRTFNELLSQIQDLQASLKNYSIEINERHTDQANLQIANDLDD